MGPKMEAKYLEILYVIELMLLTVGLSGIPLYVALGQTIDARDGFSWI